MEDAVRHVVGAGVDVVPTVLRPRPALDVGGRTVAYFSTAPPAAHPTLGSYLQDVHGAHVVHVSGNLADRKALREELEHVDAEVFLVELKAAAVDVVAEFALSRGAAIVLAANDVVSARGGLDLDGILLEMARIVV
jgi:cyclic 2,3-diphosphoglycerate synthetase